jgi:hypothetical protein
MNRYARIIQGVGWLGTALLVGVWFQGLTVRDDSPQLARHSALALAAASACVLAQLWTIAFLLLAGHGREKRLGKGKTALGGPLSALAKRRRFPALFTALLALAGLGGSFALAGAILLRHASPVAHAGAGVLAIGLQVLALWVERRALVADRLAMAELAEADEATELSAREPSGSTS